MNMKVIFSLPRRTPALAFVLAALVALLSGRAAADQGDPPEVEAQRLAHLMSYIAADYGGAVKDGAITSQAEYDE